MNARAALALAALACACGGIHAVDDPEPRAKVHRVPLKSVYVTFEQEGTKHFDQGSKEDPDGELRAIWKLDLSGRQLFLVRAGKVGGAAKAARKVLSGEHKGDAPASGDDAAEYWLVAFLGTTGSDPPAYAVESAERQGRVIRLCVEKKKRQIVTADVHLYFAWVPLGKIPDGRYTLVLYEDGKRDKGLAREVVVKRK